MEIIRIIVIRISTNRLKRDRSWWMGKSIAHNNVFRSAAKKPFVALNKCRDFHQMSWKFSKNVLIIYCYEQAIPNLSGLRQWFIEPHDSVSQGSVEQYVYSTGQRGSFGEMQQAGLEWGGQDRFIHTRSVLAGAVRRSGSALPFPFYVVLDLFLWYLHQVVSFLTRWFSVPGAGVSRVPNGIY